MTELMVNSMLDFAINTSTGSMIDLMADCLQGLRVVDLTRLHTTSTITDLHTTSTIPHATLPQP